MSIGSITNICGYCGQPGGEHLRMCPAVTAAPAQQEQEKNLGQAV